MPWILVKYFHTLSEIAGKQKDEIEVPEGTTIGQLLERICQNYGDRFRRFVFVKPSVSYNDNPDPIVNVQINGRNVNFKFQVPEGLDRVLRDGDVVGIGALAGAA